MHHCRFAAVATVAVIGLASVASAADLPVKAPVAPVAPPAYNWTGFYVGANIGGGWGSRDVAYTFNDPLSVFLFASNGPLPTSFDTSGVIGGLQIGYNYQFNRSWLFGLEADFDWSGVKGSASSALNAGLVNGNLPFTATADERIKWFGTVRARLGYLPTESLLAYITGGFAYGQVEHSGSFTNNTATGFALGFGAFDLNCSAFAACYAGSSSEVATGWTVGGGLEYAFWSRWSLKAEYLYISLDSKSIAETGVTPAGSAVSSINANFNRTNLNVARVGVNYHF